jgi:hypothetical protein
MPARRKLGLALLALSMTAPVGAAPLGAAPLGAQAVLGRCAAGAGATLAGIAALGRACPGIEAALSQLGLTALLPPGWQKTLTAGELADLGALTRRYGGSPLSELPRATALRSIAARLLPPLPPPTWSQRLAAWIRHWTVPLLHRLGRWLRSLGPGAGHSRLALALFYGLAALLLAAVLLLIFVLGGTGGGRRRRAAARAHGRRVGAGFAEPAAAPSGDPEWAQLRGSPARVLRLLVDALTRAHRLQREQHLTCRELATEARLDTDLERADFARVARLAERELYGPPGVTLLPEETLRSARMLHARLRAAAGQGAATP